MSEAVKSDIDQKLVNLTIDGQHISVPEGTLVVDAAKLVDIDIPVFCYHPKMDPVGMCRMCLVEIGRPMRDRASGELMLEEDGSPKLQFGPKLRPAARFWSRKGWWCAATAKMSRRHAER
jgi:NADH-quinone oxidoreductase subunit G